MKGRPSGGAPSQDIGIVTPLTSPVHTTPCDVPGEHFTFEVNLEDAVDVNLASSWPGPITDFSLGTGAQIPTGYMVKTLRAQSTCDFNVPSD